MIDAIYTGDCVNVMATFPAGSVDLVVTSPPYDNLREYNGYHFDFEAIAGQLWRVIKPGGVVVWVVGEQIIDGGESGSALKQAIYFMSLGFNKHQTIIYEKVGSSYPDTTRYYQVFEYMFVFSKGKPKSINLITDRKNKWNEPWGKQVMRNKDGSYKRKKQKKSTDYGTRFNIWRINNGRGYTTNEHFPHTHPAIFPEALARDHILSWSNPGDVVMDPMCGSGTTCKMAMLTGRHYIGIDISAEYCELARVRVARAKARTVEAFENGDAMPGREVGNTEELPLFAYKGGDALDPSQTAAAPADNRTAPSMGQESGRPGRRGGRANNERMER